MKQEDYKLEIDKLETLQSFKEKLTSKNIKYDEITNSKYTKIVITKEEVNNNNIKTIIESTDKILNKLIIVFSLDNSTIFLLIKYNDNTLLNLKNYDFIVFRNNNNIKYRKELENNLDYNLFLDKCFGVKRKKTKFNDIEEFILKNENLLKNYILESLENKCYVKDLINKSFKTEMLIDGKDKDNLYYENSLERHLKELESKINFKLIKKITLTKSKLIDILTCLNLSFFNNNYTFFSITSRIKNLEEVSNEIIPNLNKNVKYVLHYKDEVLKTTIDKLKKKEKHKPLIDNGEKNLNLLENLEEFKDKKISEIQLKKIKEIINS